MLGVLIGGSLGALLFKTKRGKEFQKDILHKCHDMSHTAHDYLKKEIKKRLPAKLTKKLTKKRKKR